MGVSLRTALSLALFVLLAVTAPGALATAPLEGLVHPPNLDQDEDQDQPAISTAREDAQRTQGQIVKDADQKRLEAEDTALGAYHLGWGLVVGAWGQAEHHVRDAIDRVGRLTGETLERLTRGKPSNADAGVTSESTQTIVRPADFNASLLIIAASTGASLLLIWLARRLITLGGLPLLSRIAHSDIYENDARRTVSELVIGEPGLCLNDIVQRTGFSRNAVSYHLFVLEKEEEIISVKDGKYRRYFTRNGKYVNGAKNVVAALRNETTLKLAQVVATRPGAIQRELCIELGATPSATCWHAKRLLDLGVIRKEKVSNTVKYFPGEALAKYDLAEFGLPRMTPAPSPTA